MKHLFPDPLPAFLDRLDALPEEDHDDAASAEAIETGGVFFECGAAGDVDRQVVLDLHGVRVRGATWAQAITLWRAAGRRTLHRAERNTERALKWADKTLRAAPEDTSEGDLRRACDVILTHSADHTRVETARQLLRALDRDRPAPQKGLCA